MVKYMLIVIKDDKHIPLLRNWLSSLVLRKKMEWILFDTLKGLKDFVVK